MVTKNQIKWNPDDLATPELLEPLFDDMGIDADAYPSNSAEEVAKARQAAKAYFTQAIQDRFELDGDGSLTMGEVNCSAWVFFDAYLAGLSGENNPKPS